MFDKDWRAKFPNKFPDNNYHLCYFVKIKCKNYYFTSKVTNDKHTASIKMETVRIMDTIEARGGRMIACGAETCNLRLECYVHLLLNKPGPAQVGAISKAQKQQKDFKMSKYW